MDSIFWFGLQRISSAKNYRFTGHLVLIRAKPKHQTRYPLLVTAISGETCVWLSLWETTDRWSNLGFGCWVRLQRDYCPRLWACSLAAVAGSCTAEPRSLPPPRRGDRRPQLKHSSRPPVTRSAVATPNHNVKQTQTASPHS